MPAAASRFRLQSGSAQPLARRAPQRQTVSYSKARSAARAPVSRTEWVRWQPGPARGHPPELPPAPLTSVHSVQAEEETAKHAHFYYKH